MFCYTHLQTADLKGREQGNTFTVFQEEEGGVIRLWHSPGSGAVWRRRCLFNTLNTNKGGGSVFTFIIYEWQVNKKLSQHGTYYTMNCFSFQKCSHSDTKIIKYFTVINPSNMRHLAFRHRASVFILNASIFVFYAVEYQVIYAAKCENLQNKKSECVEQGFFFSLIKCFQILVF